MLKDLFVKYLQIERNYSHYTVQSYSRDLSQFATYLELKGELFDPITLSHYSVREWVSYLLDNGVTSRSVNRKISSLQAFYVFLQRKRFCNYNPIAKVVRPKVRKKLVSFVREKEMDLLLDEIAFLPGMKGQRDRLIVELLYMTGIRESELINLKTSDVDFANAQIKVCGKRNKERVIPVSCAFLTRINQYVDCRGYGDGIHLLVTDKNSKLYVGYVYRVVNFCLRKITSVDQKSPHTLRHTFATVLLDNGANINAIRGLLGHRGLSSTEIYIHNTTKRVSEIYLQAHPRA